jgi:hypothetical protein
MPLWDQANQAGADEWDSESPDAVWDLEEEIPPSTTRRNHMIILKTSLQRLGRAEQHAKMQTASDGLKKNAELYPAPPVATTTRENRIASVKAHVDRIEDLERELEQERLLADQELTVCRADYELGANYVIGIARDDPALAIPSGYELADTPGGASAALVKIEGLEVETGDEKGELDASVRRQPGASGGGFEWQWSEKAEGPYQHIASTTKRSASLKPLPSEKRIWIRCRCFRGDEYSPWSDPVSGLVP